MKFIATLLFTSILLISCQNAKNKTGPISTPDDMQSEEINVPTDRDTTIATKNGAILMIPKGALTNNDGNRVTLEIKEAYSIQAMIRAGLITQSGDQALSSGGMIYINAKGGSEVKITHPIKVAIPANYVSKDMQLYKGDAKSDGTIDWTNPKPLPKNGQIQSIDKGKILFESQCASCHTLGKQSMGPDLAHFMKRFPLQEAPGDEMYYDHGVNLHTESSAPGFLRMDSSGRLQGHLLYKHEYFPSSPILVYKCSLIKMFRSMGPELFHQTKTDTSRSDDLLAVYRYIQNESDRRNLPLPSHAYLKASADSCLVYQQTVEDLKRKRDSVEVRRLAGIKDNGALTEEKHSPGPPPPPDARVVMPPPANYDQAVSPENNGAVYYQFTIESFGWYNIDVLMKGVDGNEKSELRVRLIGQYREKLDIFLIIPSMNAFVKGGPTGNDAGEYAFGYKDGTIYIPQNTTAYVLAYKETTSSIAFGLKKFTTTTQQDFEMSLEESTVETFNSTVSGIGDGRVKIDVHDSKNANEIRKAETAITDFDKQLKNAESLIPKGCDCDCPFIKAADSTKTKTISEMKKY